MKRLIPALVFSLTATMVFSVLAVEYIVVRKGDATRLYRVNADASLTDLTSKAQVVSDDSPAPVVPDPVELTEAGTKVRDAAAAIGDKMAAKDLAELHRRIAKLIREGKIKGPEETALAVKVAYQQLLGGKFQDWAAVRSILTDEFTASVQEGGGDAGLAKILTDTAAGLDAAGGDLQQIDLATILRIIEIVLALIEEFRDR